MSSSKPEEHAPEQVKTVRRGRPPKVGPIEIEALRAIIAEQPYSTVREISKELLDRTGTEVHPVTLAKTLKNLGIYREARRPASPAPEDTKRYGYGPQHRQTPDAGAYPSSLTDEEWRRVADLFDAPGRRGRPPKESRRKVLDACLYVVRTGCSWRMLPKDYPDWDNVYKTFRRWHKAGLFEQMHDRLRAFWREGLDRNVSPTTAVIDAQSTRHSPQGGESGIDAGKKVKGRKRHLVVDSLGLLLGVIVTAASIQDRDAFPPLMASVMDKHPGIERVYADSAYAGQKADEVERTHGVSVEIVRNTGKPWVDPAQPSLFPEEPPANGLPKRWIVERTHAWNERSRRLIMHHDRLPEVSTAWVWLSEARLLLRRLSV